MLIDRPVITESSEIINPTVPSGTSDPLLPSVGELFFRTDLNALRVFNTGAVWTEPGNTGLTTHATDGSLHLSPSQDTFLDALNLVSLTATDVNRLIGLDAYLTTQGASSLQSRLTTIDSINTTQSNNIVTLTAAAAPGGTLDTTLSNHIADTLLHVTSGQSTFLDNITASSTEINYLAGASSNIQTQLTNLGSSKLSVTGGIINGNLTIDGTLTMTTGTVTGIPTPVAATDAANKTYVDSLVSGMHWFAPARVASTANINLATGGLLTIDGVTVAVNDRVLVKDQTLPEQNGIYNASATAWSRAPDYATADAITTSALFVSEGTTQNTSSWIQINTIVILGVDPIVFTPSSGPVVNTAGNGIILAPGGTVSVRATDGLTFINGGELAVNTGTGITISSGLVALAPTGIGAATVGSSSSIPIITHDNFGRITAASSAALNSTNIAEGTNLFFTDARARSAISVAGTGLSYVPGTGVISSNATTANTPSTLVARDGAGGFSAGTITGTLSGNASTATLASSTNALSATALAAANTWAGQQLFTSTLSPIQVGTNSTLQAYSNGAGNGAYMAFHRAGVYAVNFGLDTDNVIKLGGWSDGVQSRWTSDGAGNFTARGEVAAFSDIRVKTDIQVIPNALDKVQAIRGVTYTRTDAGNEGAKQTGVIAQEVEAVLPEVVKEGENGMKTVAYGNMVGLLIEAIKELRAEVAELREQVKKN